MEAHVSSVMSCFSKSIAANQHIGHEARQFPYIFMLTVSSEQLLNLTRPIHLYAMCMCGVYVVTSEVL